MAAADRVRLHVSDLGVGLEFADAKRGRPYLVDFLSAEWRRRFASGLPKRHIFRRALGAVEENPYVVDATGGFGQDAVMALSIGCRVTVFERSSLVAQVLADGLRRLSLEEPERCERIELIEGDAVELLRGLSPAPDVVYLDPMFDKLKKSAKSPKEMQLLQELLGPVAPGENERLFAAAWAVAGRRVVVKSPLKAPALRASPTHSYKGQSIRYDVYVK